MRIYFLSFPHWYGGLQIIFQQIIVFQIFSAGNEAREKLMNELINILPFFFCDIFFLFVIKYDNSE